MKRQPLAGDRSPYLWAVALLLPVPSGEVPHPDPEKIRQGMKHVLSRPEFHPGANLSWLESALRSALEWLGKLSDTSPAVFWLLVIGLTLLLVLLLGHIAWTVRRILAVGERPATPEEVAAQRQRLSLAYQQEAHERAARQDYTEAIRYLFLALVYRLDEEGRVLFQRAYTNREYLALFADRPEVNRDLRVFVDTLDDNWYGQRPTDEQRYADCLARYEGLLRRA